MSLRKENGPDPDYKIQETLGSGAFGTVYKVQRKSDGKILAKKIIKLHDDNSIKSAAAEFHSVLELLGCRNVVQYYPDLVYDTIGRNLHIHMEYYPHGDLNSLIKSSADDNRQTDLNVVLDVFQDVVDGLNDCHAKGIIHRDIKPANILLKLVFIPAWLRLGPDNKPNNERPLKFEAYLTDFGIGKLAAAAQFGQAIYATSVAGTYPYMAPEAFRGKIGPKTDIFSLGCTIFELCESNRAYSGTDRSTTPVMRGRYSHWIKDLIISCMSYNATERPSVAEVSDRIKIARSRLATGK